MIDDHISDPDTGLFTEAFLHADLPLRVATARRGLRQLGLALLRIRTVTIGLDTIGDVVRDTLRDSDAACRLDDGRIALLLELTPVDGSLRAATRIRDALLELDGDAEVWAGVATYPVHAIDEKELLAVTEEALRAAEAHGPGSVEEAARPERP